MQKRKACGPANQGHPADPPPKQQNRKSTSPTAGQSATWQPATKQADVTVTGPAQSLLLTLTRRLPLTDREATNISVDGDTDLVQHWLDNTAHVGG
jgi:hypothetical protein